MIRSFTFIFCLICFSTVSVAQSIYSFQGLGSINHQGMPNNFNMGEVGIGTPTIWHINTQNPAFLVYNTFSTFQVGLELDSRRFTTESGSSREENGGLRYLGYAFPVMRGKWSSSFGVLPYSNVEYNTFSRNQVAGSNSNIFQEIDSRGEGGLTNLFWANGIKLNKNLMIGLRATFTFGSIKKNSEILLFENLFIENVNGITDTLEFQFANPISSELQDSYSDLNILFGAGYRLDLSETKRFNFGLTYSPSNLLNGTRLLSLSRSDNNGSQIESKEVSSNSIDFRIPQTLGFGVSYQNLNYLTIGVDFEHQNWSNSSSDTEFFRNSRKLSAGADLIPDYDDVNSYFQRVRYSIGFNYEELPYIVESESLSEFGINFGASFPVSNYSSFDMGFKWGQLGQAANGLVRENYFKIVIGATINDTWFIKRRYD